MRDRGLVANVVVVDSEEDTIETFLIDMTGADDVCLTAEIIRAGHADSRVDSVLRVSAVLPSLVDVRSLACGILRLRRRAGNEESASAFELVGSTARRIRERKPSPPPSSAGTTLSVATVSHKNLARV